MHLQILYGLRDCKRVTILFKLIISVLLHNSCKNMIVKRLLKRFFKIIAFLSLYDVIFSTCVNIFQSLTHLKAISKLCQTSKMKRGVSNACLTENWIRIWHWNHEIFELFLLEDASRQVDKIRQSAEPEWNRTEPVILHNKTQP